MALSDGNEAPIILQERKLRELSEVLGDDHATTFVLRFRNEIASRLQELEANRDTPAQLASIAHKLVGIAGALGLEELASSSHSLYLKAREASTHYDLQYQFDLVSASGNRALMAIAEHVK